MIALRQVEYQLVSASIARAGDTMRETGNRMTGSFFDAPVQAGAGQYHNKLGYDLEPMRFRFRFGATGIYPNGTYLSSLGDESGLCCGSELAREFHHSRASSLPQGPTL